MDTNENIIKKLNYLGLNDSKNFVKSRIHNFNELEYRPINANSVNLYKVYRYVNVQDIEIFLTKANRLSEISEKCKNANSINDYLINNIENNAKYNEFINLVEKMDINRIEQIEEIQEKIKKTIPFKIKYKMDYLWQIYYSENTDKYFMLVPMDELDQSAFFYLLKKQLEQTNERIFVPICYLNYSNKYLDNEQFSDIEKFLWLFTKEWPLLYEVYDIENKVTINIVGRTNIYDNLKSYYKVKLKNKEDAIKFYKLLKALFIIQSQIPNYYKFETLINNVGELEFRKDNKKIIYEILPSFLKEEYLKVEEKKIKVSEEKLELEKELDILQKKCTKLENQYLEKEKQIATFLQCKKTFFGRVKYFIKYKKVKLASKEQESEKKQEIKVIRLNKYEEVKSNYTIEELIEIYKQFEKEELRTKNLKLDIKATEQKMQIFESKVKNAIQYIEEIDKHKKSIFEFWKFTNKDKKKELPEGNVEEEKEKLNEIFDYDLDFEKFSKKIDMEQRQKLSKIELDDIFLTTELLQDINKIAKKEKLDESRLKEIKQEFVESSLTSKKDSFDIFAGISSNNRIQIIGNKKHRETKKEIFSILNINKNTTLLEYEERIKDIIKTLNLCFKNISLNIDMPVYRISTEDINNNIYNKFYFKPTNKIVNINEKDKELTMYKVNLKKNTPIVAYTNSIFYNNDNKTLPLGMDISESILLNNNLLELELKNYEEMNILFDDDSDNNIEIKRLKVFEYDLKN